MKWLCASFLPTVIPEVSLTTFRTRVGPGCTATLLCSIARGNPTNYTYSWTHEGTPVTRETYPTFTFFFNSWNGDGNPISGETYATLGIPFFSVGEVGTYSCEVTNDVGTGMDSITLELGGEKHLVLYCVFDWFLPIPQFFLLQPPT